MARSDTKRANRDNAPRATRVGVTVLEGTCPSDVLIPVDALHRIGDGFDVELIGVSRTPTHWGSVLVKPTRTIASPAIFDLVIVPSLGFDVDRGLELNPRFGAWLRRQRDAGATISSWCTGSFLLAAAGVVDGIRVTTHWASARAFEARFPRVPLDVDEMLIDEGSVVTAGGATAVYPLIVHLVRRHAGDRRATQVARECLVDLGRPSQRAYSDDRIFEAHLDAAVHGVQHHVREHLRGDLSLDRLARQAKLSSRTLTRRFRSAIGVTPVQFVQAARVEAAKTLLATDDASFETITIRVGYHDPRAFRRLFKRLTSMSPRAYRGLFVRGRS